MYLNPFTILIALLAVLVFFLHLHLDYLAFKALGPGGTPATIHGFIRIKLLSIVAIRDPTTPRRLRDRDDPCGFLTNIPKQGSERPRIRGIAPHRQITSKATAAMIDTLSSMMLVLSSDMKNVVTGVSCVEGHGDKMPHGDSCQHLLTLSLDL